MSRGGPALRLDVALVRRGLFPSRQRAAAAVMAGTVLVAGQPARKAGQAVSPDAELTVLVPDLPYVSRGGLKLAAALDAFALVPADWVCLDVGASTGGFTDCLLQRGAARVYAVDVGHGQLAWRLRQDPRVVVRERVNARHGLDAHVPEPVDLAVVDVSFISLGMVLPAVVPRVRAGGAVVPLIKPQFEAGRGQVGAGGIVRDPAVHRQVLEGFGVLARHLGWPPHDLIPSPVTGADGNREFLALLRGGSPTRPWGTLMDRALAGDGSEGGGGGGRG